MTKSDFAKMLLSFIQADDAPAVAVKAKPKGKGKRTLTDEQKAKMAEGRRKAAAAKAKPAAKAAEKASTKEEFAGGIAFGEGREDKKGRVWVPFWIGDEYAGSMRADVARKVFIAIRGAAASDMLAHLELQAERA